MSATNWPFLSSIVESHCEFPVVCIYIYIFLLFSFICVQNICDIVHPRKLTCMEIQNFAEDRVGCHPTGPSYVYHQVRRLTHTACHDLAALCRTSATLTASCLQVCKISNFSKQSNQVSRISLRKSRLDLA